MISQIRFGLQASLLTCPDFRRIQLATQSSLERECPSTAGETDPRTYTEVLPGIDRVRRFYTWEWDEDDERALGAVFAHCEPGALVPWWVQVPLSGRWLLIYILPPTSLSSTLRTAVFGSAHFVTDIRTMTGESDPYSVYKPSQVCGFMWSIVAHFTLNRERFSRWRTVVGSPCVHHRSQPPTPFEDHNPAIRVLTS